LGVPHQLDHPFDEGLKLLIEDFNRRRPAGEHGVWIQNDLRWLCWNGVHCPEW
jgi:hypothetical protein